MINKLIDDPYISNWEEIFPPVKTCKTVFRVRSDDFARLAGILMESNVFNYEVLVTDLTVVSGEVSYGKLNELRIIKDLVEENLGRIEKEILKIIFREFFDRTANMKLVTEFDALSISEKARRIDLPSYAGNRDLTRLIIYYRTIKNQ